VLAPQGRQLTEEATMDEERDSERFETVIIGGGQAGLAVGRQLIRLGLSSVILDAGDRVGDVWRTRWDSLRLFTPARYDGLPGLPFPAPRYSFPTKDEMADYLEAYADHFQLPVRNGVTVAGLRREGDRHMLRVGGRWLEADRVVVATGACHSPHIPAFAGQLDPGIVQLHSQDYRRPSQLRGGGVLVVGAGNSGAEIALEAAKEHRTWLAGRHPGHLPVRHGPAAARFVFPVVRLLGSRVLTLDTPIGRKVRPRFVSRGAPLIRVRPNEYATAGIERVPRVTGVRDGWPLLADGRVLEVANVVLVHRLRARLVLDRFARLHRRGRAAALARRCRRRAGPVLRRAAVPVRGHLAGAARRRPRRGVRGQTHRRARGGRPARRPPDRRRGRAVTRRWSGLCSPARPSAPRALG
jgi:putative flavoprotein involved in K+ transport